EVLVGLDLLEHLAAVLAREVEVQQYEVRPRGALVPVAAVEEVERLHAVGHDVQRVVDLVELEPLLDQDDVAGVVLDEQDVDDRQVLNHGETSSGVGSGTGSVKRRVAREPWSDGSSQMRPPWCSITLRHIARPIPVPA